MTIQRAAGGHPLAIALLAGEYDVGACAANRLFAELAESELAAARRAGLAGHHITFTTAFERSYAHLTPGLQRALAALSAPALPVFCTGGLRL